MSSRTKRGDQPCPLHPNAVSSGIVFSRSVHAGHWRESGHSGVRLPQRKRGVLRASAPAKISNSNPLQAAGCGGGGVGGALMMGAKCRARCKVALDRRRCREASSAAVSATHKHRMTALLCKALVYGPYHLGIVPQEAFCNTQNRMMLKVRNRLGLWS